MKKSFSKRLKLTKRGKIIHRPMAVDHFQSKRSGEEKQQTRKVKLLQYPNLKILKLWRTQYKIAKQ